MKKRIRNKMMNNPGRYKLHQYLKYARQWFFHLCINVVIIQF